ncbi:MAG TPA: transposase [Parafilimonas sp.]|nr:transposase [Parafilimonas sp.]
MADAYRIKDQYVAYFITLTVIDWVDVFTRKEYKDTLIESLKYCIQNKGLHVYEFVIMSNHLHAIISSDKLPLSDIIRDFKKFTAKQIIEQIINSNESRKEWLLKKFAFAGARNSNNKTYQFWQQDYHAVELSNEKMWRQRTDYIHNNPVRAGFVEHAEDYLYSSARFYYNKKCLIDLAAK